MLKLQLLCTHCPPQQLSSTAFLTVHHFCTFLSQFFTAVLQLLKVYIHVHVKYSPFQKLVRVLRKNGARFMLTAVYAVELAPQPAKPRPD
jgi:hypothetical protein